MLVVWTAAVLGCGKREPPRRAEAASAPVPAEAGVDGGGLDADVDARVARLDPDGDDEAQELGTGALPVHLHPVKVGTPPLAHERICDLSSFGGALYAAHAVQPLGIDGATITKYTPGDSSPFRVAFDWNRWGEPSKGGGAGQGFLRIHAIGGRLYVPDSDPPYDGFGYLDHGTEGYVFVSDANGVFAKAIGEHKKPPLAPTADRPGAMVLPRAYHVIDVIRFRGSIFASTGSVPPHERAWSGPSPGALHVADDAGTRMDYVLGYPDDARKDVWRLTFLVRFHDRLYSGIQEYFPREPNDYLVFEPPATERTPSKDSLRAVRVTRAGGSMTLRWYADPKTDALFWIARAVDTNRIELRMTHDGDRWDMLDLPLEAGAPTDVVRFRDALVVLAEHALYRLDGTKLTELGFWADETFAAKDYFCVAPLAVHGNELYAGGQKGGALHRFEP